MTPTAASAPPTTLGTILPTAASLAAADANAYKIERRKLTIAARAGLDKYPQRVIGRETRYYLSPSMYAIVGRSGKVLCFAEMAGGDYATAAPSKPSKPSKPNKPK